MRNKPSLAQILWRHKTSFGSIFIAGSLASTLALNSIPATYQSRAIIEFPQHVSLAHAVNTAQSAERLETVIAQLDLENDTRFNPTVTDAAPSLSSTHSKFKTLNLFSEDDTLATQKNLGTLVNILRNGLRVRPLETAGQIEISFTSSNPDLSAQLTNTLAALEIENTDYKKSNSAEIFSTLSYKINALQNTLAALDTEIIEKRAEFAHAQLEAQSAYTNKLAALENDLEILNTKRALLETTPTTSEKLAQLEQEKATLGKQQKSFAMRYGHKHPQIIALSKKITANSLAIAAEQTTIQTAHQEKQNNIDSDIALLEIELGSIAPAAGNEKDEELEKLEQTRRRHNTALQSLLAAQKQNAQTIEKPRDVPELVLTATPNDTPVATNKPVMMAYAIGFFALLGLAPGILIETRRRKTFQSTYDLEAETGRPCFSRLALVGDFDDKPVADYILHHPHSQASEAVKALRMQLKLRSPQSETGQVVMVSSALPNEGKTTTALWIARQAAQSGMHTILVDADLRTSGVHKALLADNTASLVDVLTGRRLLDHCIRKDLKTGLHVLLGSPAPNSAADLLSDKSFALMLTSLRKNYDLIIIDTHAALSVADSRAIAAQADQILFMVRWNETPRNFVHNAIAEISGFSTAPIATVLAAVDVEEQAKLGLGDVICTLEAA